MPQEIAPCNWLSIIMLDTVTEVKKKYYSQTLLEEYKWGKKRIIIINPLDDDLEKCDFDNDSNNEAESDIDNDESDE